MKRLSHLALGRYLIDNSLGDLPATERTAFMLGCIQPDYNPLSYIKGSFTICRLRGHHFRSAQAVMKRLAKKLENAEFWGPVQYYMLGKLVHYICDSFTWAHNDFFMGDLNEHCEYEADLQAYFLETIEDIELRPIHRRGNSVFGLIMRQHNAYEQEEFGVVNDTNYSIQTAFHAVEILEIPEPEQAWQLRPATIMANALIVSLVTNGIVDSMAMQSLIISNFLL